MSTVLKTEKLKNGAILRFYSTGAVTEQAPGKHEYRTGNWNPSTWYAQHGSPTTTPAPAPATTSNPAPTPNSPGGSGGSRGGGAGAGAGASGGAGGGTTAAATTTKTTTTPGKTTRQTDNPPAAPNAALHEIQPSAASAYAARTRKTPDQKKPRDAATARTPHPASQPPSYHPARKATTTAAIQALHHPNGGIIAEPTKAGFPPKRENERVVAHGAGQRQAASATGRVARRPNLADRPRLRSSPDIALSDLIARREGGMQDALARVASRRVSVQTRLAGIPDGQVRHLSVVARGSLVSSRHLVARAVRKHSQEIAPGGRTGNQSGEMPVPTIPSDVIVGSFDALVELVAAVHVQRTRASAVGRALRGSSKATVRSAAARALPGAGRLSQELANSAVLEAAAKLAPFAGFGGEFVVDMATGESTERSVARAVGSVALTAVGEEFGATVCGMEVVATAGSGALLCGVLVWGGGVAGGFVGSEFGGYADDLARWIGAHLP